VQCGRGQSNVQQMQTRCRQRTEAADAVRTAGTNFLSAPSLVITCSVLPFTVVRIKLRLSTISMIMLTICQSGSNRSSSQVRARCHTVLQVAVKSTNTAPDFFAEKLSSMSCVSRVTWYTADLPCRKPASSCGSNGSMIGLTRAL